MTKRFVVSKYVVVENTPGYLPDDENPGRFYRLSDAKAHARELAGEYPRQDYKITKSEDGRLYNIEAKFDDNDLGRVIDIKDDDSGELIEVWPGEPGYNRGMTEEQAEAYKREKGWN